LYKIVRHFHHVPSLFRYLYSSTVTTPVVIQLVPLPTLFEVPLPYLSALLTFRTLRLINCCICTISLRELLNSISTGTFIIGCDSVNFTTFRSVSYCNGLCLRCIL